MRLKSHRRVNTQIKQEAEGKRSAVSLPARFSLLPLELACGGVGNHRLKEEHVSSQGTAKLQASVC